MNNEDDKYLKPIVVMNQRLICKFGYVNNKEYKDIEDLRKTITYPLYIYRGEDDKLVYSRTPIKR